MKYLDMKYSTKALVLPLLFTTIACGKSQDSGSYQLTFNERMNRQAYLGSTESTMYLHGYDRLAPVKGKGSFSIDKIKGDSSTLVLVMELSGQEGFSFAIPGKQTGRSWRFTAKSGELSVADNGEVNGSLTASAKEITWKGRLFDDKMMLDVKIKYLKSGGGVPAESILNTHFELLRSGSQQGGNGQQGCTIVWESRPVFNVYEGGVDLIYVPVCH